MPSGGHGHYIGSRAEIENVRFWQVRTDAGPVLTGRPVSALCGTTSRIVNLDCGPAPISTQCFQPRESGLRCE
jgi:hypothetical protein